MLAFETMNIIQSTSIIIRVTQKEDNLNKLINESFIKAKGQSLTTAN